MSFKDVLATALTSSAREVPERYFWWCVERFAQGVLQWEAFQSWRFSWVFQPRAQTNLRVLRPLRPGPIPSRRLGSLQRRRLPLGRLRRPTRTQRRCICPLRIRVLWRL